MHSAKVAALHGGEEKKKAVRSFLKPLRERSASRLAANVLYIAPRPRRDTHWTAWLSPEPSQDRLRDINNSNRTTSGLQEWPLQWLTMPGVVCYERAHGRIRNERGGEIDEDFVKRLVWTGSLPTALASPSDHYVLVQPGKGPRYLSVEEVMRAFGLPAGG